MMVIMVSRNDFFFQCMYVCFFFNAMLKKKKSLNVKIVAQLQFGNLK